MEPRRGELVKAIALVAVIWVAGLWLLARWQRQAPPSRTAPEPVLVHYPGTEDAEEQTSPSLGLRKYWFTLQEDYPSLSVYHFYRRLLEPQGWTPLTRREPVWVRHEARGVARDILQVIWVSPDGLFQLELQMMSVARPVKQDGKVVGEAREPGIEVFVTQRRALHPGIILQDRRPRTPESGIETPAR